MARFHWVSWFKKKKKSDTTVVPTRPRTADELAAAIEEAKRRLAEHDRGASDRALGFARSLLAAVGEDPETGESELIAYQMAVEHFSLVRPASA